MQNASQVHLISSRSNSILVILFTLCALLFLLVFGRCLLYNFEIFYRWVQVHYLVTQKISWCSVEPFLCKMVDDLCRCVAGGFLIPWCYSSASIAFRPRSRSLLILKFWNLTKVCNDKLYRQTKISRLFRSPVFQENVWQFGYSVVALIRFPSILFTLCERLCRLLFHLVVGRCLLYNFEISPRCVQIHCLVRQKISDCYVQPFLCKMFDRVCHWCCKANSNCEICQHLRRSLLTLFSVVAFSIIFKFGKSVNR